MRTHREHHYLKHEKGYDDGAPPKADSFDALHPDVVVPAISLKHRPYAVVEMQPQGHKADNVDDGSPDILESELEIERAEFGSGRSAVNGGPCSGVVAYNFGKLHFCPELDEVHHEECEHHHSEHEHVFGRPFHLGLAGSHFVAVVAAGAAVLQCEPQSVNNVDDEQQGETHGCSQCIPVGSEESADAVVGRGPQQGHSIHRRMKCYE